MTNLKAKKSLGQNFLINQGVIDRIVQAADLSPHDTVLEVGPGTGNLTHALVKTGAQIIAVEKDRRAIEALREEFKDSNIKIIEEDILKFDPIGYGLVEGGYKIVANIPYYITGHFLKTVLESWPRPQLIVLMIQKEVAQRMTAKPPHMNLLALSVQYYADPEIIMSVSAGSFRPIPTVDSAVIKLTPRKDLGINFLDIARLGFKSKRKKLVNNLLANYDKAIIEDGLSKTGLSLDIRAENLSIQQWQELAKNLSTQPLM